MNHRDVDSKNATDFSARRMRPGLTLIECLVVLSIIVVMIALLLPAVRTAREPARRTQCKNNLKQIGLALHNYHETYHAFPPAYTVDADGKPLHSWRTLILPYLDHAALYNKIDLSKPWDDPANEAAFKTPVSAYACPSHPLQQFQTAYLAVVTSNSCLRPGQSLATSQIQDGTGTTVIVIEAPLDQGVHWMAPQDADEKLLQTFGPKSKEAHALGQHALLADGAVRFLPQTIAPETFQALLSATGGDTVDKF